MYHGLCVPGFFHFGLDIALVFFIMYNNDETNNQQTDRCYRKQFKDLFILFLQTTQNPFQNLLQTHHQHHQNKFPCIQ